MNAYRHGADAPGLAAPEPANHPFDIPAPLSTVAAHSVVTITGQKATGAASVGASLQRKTLGVVWEKLADEGKRLAALRAHLALRGSTLARTDSSTGMPVYFAARWCRVRELRDLVAVAEFPARTGGRQ